MIEKHQNKTETNEFIITVFMDYLRVFRKNVIWPKNFRLQ